jgi:hypothetical protein
MTYTSLATPVPNNKILVSSFGGLVKTNLDDHEGRILSAEARLTTLETPTKADCAYYLAGASGANLMNTTNTYSLITAWTPIPPAVSYAGLITHSAGVFTIAKTGYWAFGLNLRWNAGGTDLYAMIGESNTKLWARTPVTGPLDAAANVPPRRYVAGQEVRTYAYSGAARNLTRDSTNDLIPAFYITYLGT